VHQRRAAGTPLARSRVPSARWRARLSGRRVRGGGVLASKCLKFRQHLRARSPAGSRARRPAKRRCA